MLRTYCVKGLNETPLPALLLHRGLCIDLQAELVGIGVDVFEDVSHGMLVRNPVFLTQEEPVLPLIDVRGEASSH